MSGFPTGDLNPIYNVPMLGTHKSWLQRRTTSLVEFGLATAGASTLSLGRKDDLSNMQTKLSFYVVFLIAWVRLAAPASAEEWRGLTVSCKVIKGGYDLWGMDADYSLMVRCVNGRGNEPVTIRMHEPKQCDAPYQLPECQNRTRKSRRNRGATAM